MFSLLKGAFRPVAVALLSVASLTVSAQTVTTPTTCIAAAGGTATYTFTPASGTPTVAWSTRGDISVSGTGYTVTATSTGKGPGVVVATYSGGCSGTAESVAMYKSFSPKTPTNYPIVGPTCVAPGVVTYSIEPLVTKPNVLTARIVADTYRWEVWDAANTTLKSAPGTSTAGYPAIPATSAVTEYAGDFSAVRFSIPSGCSPFTLRVYVGKCNGANDGLGSVYQSLVVNTSPTLPAFTFPACKLTNDTTHITVTTPATAGLTYKFTLPSSWRIYPATARSTSTGVGASVQVKIRPDGLPYATSPATPGDISVTVSNASCGSVASVPFRIDRQLAPTGTSNNALTVTPALGTGSCFARETNYTFTVPNPPVGAPIAWSYSASLWSVISQTASAITLRPTATLAVNSQQQSATVTATAGGGCTGVSLTGTIRGTIATCALSIENSAGCGSYIVNSGSCSGVSGLRYGQWRLYDLSSPTPSVPVDLYGSNASPSPSNTGIFFTYTTPISAANLRVEVDVTTAASSSQCFSQLVVATGSTISFSPCRPAPAPGGGSGPVKGGDDPAQLRAYPNPAGQTLTVELPAETRGSVTLVVSDATGRTYRTLTTDKRITALDVRTLPQGVYSIKAVLPGGKLITQTVQVRH